MARGGTAPFYVGAQSVADVGSLEAWMRRAAAGEEFVYCEALEPIRGETWMRAGELAREGFVRTHERKRAGGGKQYFAVRTSKALSRTVSKVEATLADAATATIWRELKRAANLGMPCPTDADLARKAGLTSRDQAQWRVRKLADLTLIKSELAYEGGVPTRVVTIVETGKFTALPKKWAALQRAAQREAGAR